MAVSQDGPALPGSGFVMGGQDPPNEILVDLNTEGVGDLLSNLRAAEARVAPLYLDDGVD